MRKKGTGEPDAINVARPVRWGAVGKGPGNRHLAGGLPNRTPGSASGTEKRTGGNTGTALRADSTDRDSFRRSVMKQEPTETVRRPW
jgi:hypothetical protein